MLYYGGGGANDDIKYVVYCCDLTQDKWTTLPPLPVKHFGLGQINGKLVAVGGVSAKTGWECTNEVYTFDDKLNKWKKIIPPMPTAKDSPAVISLQSALITAGGHTQFNQHITNVEVFISDKSQWYKTDALPTACRDLSAVTSGDTCYVLGGYEFPVGLNQALRASVDDLLCNAVPANKFNHTDNTSIWKALPNTPTYQPAAAVLASSLITIGGTGTAEIGSAQTGVYMYSPTTNSWVYIGDLPAPRALTTTTVLSPTELLVIGGWDGKHVKSVLKGILTMIV